MHLRLGAIYAGCGRANDGALRYGRGIFRKCGIDVIRIRQH